jgi:quercetin dioxygenase-like cupin family protein
MKYLVQFETLAWESVAPGIRHKVHRVDAVVLRLVEYSQEMVPHWCSKGHIGHIIAGALELEFEAERVRFDTGSALFIPPGPEHAHRAIVLTPRATALFVEGV